jgi:hypothetical protein
MAAAGKLGIPVKQDGTPEPGGWAKSLVAGAQTALASKAATSVEGAAGDVGAGLSAIGQIPKGSGKFGAALIGAGRGLNASVQAGNQRRQQQFQNKQETTKNQALTAEANMRMIHEQRLVHNMDEDTVNASIVSGNQAADKLQSNPSPSPIIAKGLTSDELNQYLKDKKIDPTNETAYPTGRKVVGENPDGTPQYRTTYTAMGLPPSVDLDPENPKDKAILDDLNKYSPPAEGQGKWGSTGKQTLTGTQFNFAMQQVAEGRAATAARNTTLVNQKLADAADVKKLEAVNFGQNNPAWIKVLGTVPNHDPIAARNAILANPDLAAKFPNLDSDLTYMYGEKAYDSMLDTYQKKVEMGFDEVNTLQKEVDKAHGEDAAGIAGSIQAKMDANPDMPSSVRTKYSQMLKQANSAAQSSEDYHAREKQNDINFADAAKQGNVDSLVDMARQYEMSPKDMASMRTNDRQKMIAALHAADPTWDIKVYAARYKTSQEFTPEAKGGLAVQSLNTFAGHTAEANSLISTLQNKNSPLLNRPLNKIKEALGSDKIGAYKTSLLASRKEYINFLNNQHAESEIDNKEMDRLISEDTTPANAQAILRQMAKTVAIRARSMNSVYRTTMGKDIPDLLDPDTQQALKNWGIDPAGVTTTGPSGFVKPTNATGGAATSTVQGVKVPPGMVYIQKPDNTYGFYPVAKQDELVKAGGKVVQ